MPEFKYFWLHVQTGQQGHRTIKCKNELEFLQKLNRWNSVGMDCYHNWKYWA